MNSASPAPPPAATEGNGFWGMSAIGKPGNCGTSSFESFLPDEEPSFEEPVAPPKKKSPVVLEFATPAVNDQSTPPPPTLENPALGEASNASDAETPPATEETPSSPIQGKAHVSEDGESKAETPPATEETSSSPLQGEAPVSEDGETVSLPSDDLHPPVADPNDQKEFTDFSEDQTAQQDFSSSGTESAPDEQMVSLATYEDAISQEAPPTDMAASAGDTASVSTSKAFQVSTPPLPGPLLATPHHVSPSSTNPLTQAHQLGTSRAHVADASGVLKLLQMEAGKLSQFSGSQIQLDLTVDTGDSVRIRLNLRGNELFTAISTDSPDLRDALQKSWPEFLSNQKDRPYRFAESQFQDSFNAPNQRESRGQTPFESPDERSASILKKRRPGNPAPNIRSNQPVQLWA